MPDETAGAPGERARIVARKGRDQAARRIERQRRLELAATTAERLAATIEMYDPGCPRHVGGVASIAAMLATELGFDDERALLLRAAAPMHDVGVAAIPDGVLQTREKLTPSERECMEAHTIVGYRILAGSGTELLEMAAGIALGHHEWFDGSGYPQGLSGDAIPIESRVVAVADVFDALLRERPHRPPFAVEEARRLIASERETHFDPAVADALLDNLREAVALRG